MVVNLDIREKLSINAFFSILPLAINFYYLLFFHLSISLLLEMYFLRFHTTQDIWNSNDYMSLLGWWMLDFYGVDRWAYYILMLSTNIKVDWHKYTQYCYTITFPLYSQHITNNIFQHFTTLSKNIIYLYLLISYSPVYIYLFHSCYNTDIDIISFAQSGIFSNIIFYIKPMCHHIKLNK